MEGKVANIGLRAASIIALFALWWSASVLMHDPSVLPDPFSIGHTIIRDLATPGPEGESAYFHIAITLARIFVAFSASMTAGIAIGLSTGVHRGRGTSALA